MASPSWITPAGFLGTVTERTSTSTAVQAYGNNITYKLISGSLPGGLRFSSTGAIAGTPYSVGEIVKSQFVVRAENADGVTDRTFYLDTDGPTSPQWLTPEGFLSVGFNRQFYSVNKQYVDYQLSAEYDRLPAGQKLRYFIEDGAGQLPPGLELQEDGRIVGQIQDKLKLSYKSAVMAGFDEESYDDYPYDHVSVFNSTLSASAKFIGKTYQFYVTATDGVSNSKRYFKIRVEDPASLRVDNSYINIDSDQYLSDAGYLLSPQWLTSVNLGVVRANNKQVIKLNVYDFNPGTGSVKYDWNTPKTNQDGTPSVHPTHFELDPVSGVLYATLSYQPAWSISYSFTIWVIKTDYQTKEETLTARTFTLAVRGDIETTIEWVSNENIGTLAPGYVSELSIVAQHIGAPYSIEYALIDGSLPTGLTLSQDGTITGQIEYDSQIYFDRVAYGANAFLLDGGTTTIDKKHTFIVRASDIYQTSAIEKQFYITVSDISSAKATKIYAEPLLKTDQRRSYSTFINDSYTFNRSLMYRIEDKNFGIQQKIRMYFEHGAQQIDINGYSDAMREYFYRKRFVFGDIKWTKATDSNGNYVYDVVYVDIIDPLNGLSGPRTVSGNTVHQNSMKNMRDMLESITVEGVTINTDEYLMPRFMRTIQPSTGSPLGFIMAVPLCYALPGKGDTIVKRIAVSGFEFSTINFEIDRLIVEDNLTESGAKYLLFPRRDVSGTNLGENRSYIVTPEGLGLDTEDGVPLQVEL